MGAMPTLAVGMLKPKQTIHGHASVAMAHTIYNLLPLTYNL
jgi:hypothetical protein